MQNQPNDLDFLAGGGEMGERMRSFNWKSTSLGEPKNWPRSLKTCVRIMLTSQQPIWIGWGKELIKLYNDPYKSIVGGKHPDALGQPASVVWKDIWADIAPMLSKVMNDNEGTYSERQLLIMERYGYKEETYYTFSYSPVPGDDGLTEGMICYNTPETEGVLNERSLKTLRDLGDNLQDCKKTSDVFVQASLALSENLFDFPFSIFYDCSESKITLLTSSGISAGHPLCPTVVSENDFWNIAEALEEGKPKEVSNLPLDAPKGCWPEAPKKAMVFPIFTERTKRASHVFIAALNPYRKYDHRFEGFTKLIVEQVSQAINNVEAFEAEKRRAQMLEELDRSKTVFFSNISHEFRTPITLMLGPLEELLNKPQSGFTKEEKENLDTTHRNAMRLLKLVNGLLDFSKVESGRMQARFVMTNVPQLTKKLASNFYSLMEKAGLKFTVNADSIIKPAYIDRQMWEKIIFNLLSNAFKYTHSGEVSLTVSAAGNSFMVQVKDTGVGIPAAELPKMFNRFHRVAGVTGRTHEGTGIGLSMVKELVKLHGGKIEVESEQGVGSQFTITIPFGKDHLPEEKVFDSDNDIVDTVSDAFITEAESLLGDKEEPQTAKAADAGKPKILVTDDNPDMRNYLLSLLRQKYHVIQAVNGLDALHKVKEFAPDLILSDIMMPIMDGTQLTRELKTNHKTAAIPLILITARAGEESKIEGFEIGADDYLTKPFSSRELMSRIAAHLQMAEVRKRSHQAIENEKSRLFEIFMQAPAIIAVLKGPEHVFELANPKYRELVGTDRDLLGRPVAEALPEVVAQGFIKLLDEVYRSDKPYLGTETMVELDVNGDGKMTRQYLNFVYQPYRDINGQVQGIIVHAVDVTGQVEARMRIEESERLFRTLAETLPQMIWIRNIDGTIEYASKDWEEYSGVKNISEAWMGMMHPDDKAAIMEKWAEHETSGQMFVLEVRLKNKNGEYRWHQTSASPLMDSEGRITRWIGAITDIHAQKIFTERLESEVLARTRELKRSNDDLQQFAHVASHDLKEPVRKVKTFLNIIQTEYGKLMDERGKMYIDKVQLSMNRIKAMIEGVLHYSTIDSSEFAYNNVDLNQVIDNIKKDLEIVIAAKHAVITADNLPKVKGVEILLHQLFYNLINNSLKFSKDAELPHIQIKAGGKVVKEKKYVEVTIADNGIGFDDSKKEEIFKTFKRLHSKDDYEGTGLGLSLCRKIVERHGGEISATGEPGKGAEFRILFPVSEN